MGIIQGHVPFFYNLFLCGTEEMLSLLLGAGYSFSLFFASSKEIKTDSEQSSAG